MKRVLIIGSTDIMGGIGHISMEYCQKCDKKQYHFDFLYYIEPSEKDYEIIKKIKADFYFIPRYSKNFFAFLNEINKFYKLNHYDIIHCHAATASLIMYTLPVWKKEKPIIIFQSHCDKGNTKIIHYFFRRIVIKYSKVYIAVSEKAGFWMFGKKNILNNKCYILKNGIESKNFKFDEKRSVEEKKRLEINDKFVVGNVGRFEVEKNHKFIVEVFNIIKQKRPDSILLLVGKGRLMSDIKKQVEVAGLLESTIFYGCTSNVADLYQVMDVFLFPSKWEGLGIVAIEAQAAGIPVLASESVPKETKILPSFRYMGLSESVSSWADTILYMSDKYKKEDSTLLIQNAGYDISDVIKRLEDIYNHLTN